MQVKVGQEGQVEVPKQKKKLTIVPSFSHSTFTHTVITMLNKLVIFLRDFSV